MLTDGSIYLGDWQDLIAGVPDGSVGLVLTDPPYQSTPCKWDRRPKWDLFFPEMARVCGNAGQMWMFGRQPWLADLVPSARESGWIYVQELIWEKQNAGGCTVGTFRKVHENIWHFKRAGSTVFNLSAVRVPKTTEGDKSVKRRSRATTQYMGGENSAYSDDGLRMPRSVVRCRNLHRSEESLGHPTQKPVALVEPLVVYSTNPGDLVFDPFCGTGTSLVAAKAQGRRWIGFEGDQEWHAVACARLGVPVPVAEQGKDNPSVE